jgi:hypothetical protein
VHLLQACLRHSDAWRLLTNALSCLHFTCMSTSGSRPCTIKLNARDHTQGRGSTHTCGCARQQVFLKKKSSGLQFFTNFTVRNGSHQNGGLFIYLYIYISLYVYVSTESTIDLQRSRCKGWFCGPSLIHILYVSIENATVTQIPPSH